MRVLLTGATGLVGPHVLERLLARGDVVRVLALPNTLDKIQPHRRVEILPGNLVDRSSVSAAVDKVEVVYHLGALLGSELENLFKVNVLGTENLLRSSIAGGVSRFVFASSVAVYTPSPFPWLWPLSEDSPLKAHGNRQLQNYGQTKIDAEKLIQHFHQKHRIEYVIVRPPTVYSRRAPWFEMLLRHFMEEPRRGCFPGADSYHMQWVHADDLADGIVLAGTRSEAANNVFNLASDELVTPLDILDILQTVGRWREWRLRSYRRSNSDLKYDTGKARRMLGFTPKRKIAEMIEEIVGGLDDQGE